LDPWFCSGVRRELSAANGETSISKGVMRMRPQRDGRKALLIRGENPQSWGDSNTRKGVIRWSHDGPGAWMGGGTRYNWTGKGGDIFLDKP